MRIQRVSYERLQLKLNKPYTIAYETVSEAVNYILRLETDQAITGWGCAAPDPAVTHETQEAAEQAIQDVIVPCLQGEDPFRFARVQHNLKNRPDVGSSVRAMVDMALYDILAKSSGVPLYKLLGGYRDSIPTSITVGIMSVEDTLKEVKEYQSQGFGIVKIKGGLDVDEDIEKIRCIRRAFADIQIRFDGNQGYSVEDSIRFFEETRAAGIEIFEQPTRVGEDQMLGAVTDQVDIPVMADESIKTLRDTYRLAKNDRIDMINIKIMKVGGILEGMHINSVAKSAGVEVMVGCLDECALGIAAGLHFALSRPNIEYADLDGHLDLINDPFTDLFTLKEGVLYPKPFPGLSGHVSL